MFLKSLLISTPTKVIREINFHKGLNLIVDETPSGDTLTGNNVGKTTVLRLIDFCLGKDGSVVYKDPENSREIDPMVKSFLETLAGDEVVAQAAPGADGATWLRVVAPDGKEHVVGRLGSVKNEE